MKHDHDWQCFNYAYPGKKTFWYILRTVNGKREDYQENGKPRRFQTMDAAKAFCAKLLAKSEVATPMFDRLQLIFLVDTLLTSAWDTIQSILPEDAADLQDFRNYEVERRNLISGVVQNVAHTLPILFSRLTNDGMGVAEFGEYDRFNQQVWAFVAARTKRPSSKNHPPTRSLAESFVKHYLEKVTVDAA